MAEAFARRLAPAGVEVLSAGSRPASSVNPVVVGMGCGDACPVRPGAKTVAWEIPDPKGQPLERVREIRDQIEGKVGELLEGL